MTKPQYYLYARKSTDDEDHQIMSIEAQIFELREYARREGLEIIEEITEARSAKIPGREKFGKMIAEIEKSSGVGILAWHPDRLARNSIDGGRIIYLVDTGKIATLRFPTFWFEPTPQGKFMLNIAFGQSKYYVDNLSENVKRGLRQKVRLGEAPIKAPLGYINDLRSKTIEPNPEVFKKLRSIFEEFAIGNYSLTKIQDKMFFLGFAGKDGKALKISTIQWILTNPFYYGMFMYQGELCEGNHKPMITKKVFDKVQKALKDRSKPRKEKVVKNFIFRHFANCGECGYSIIAELKTKKSGRQYVYYRCSHKSTKEKCGQRYYLPEKELAESVKDYVRTIGLTDRERDICLSIVSEWEKESVAPLTEQIQKFKNGLSEIKAKIDRLSDAYLDGAFELEEYKQKKNKLVEQKKETEEKLADLRLNGNRWLEPVKKLVLEANQAQKSLAGENFAELRNFLKEYGSNRKILNRRLLLDINEPLVFLQKGPNESPREAGAEKICYERTIWRPQWESNPCSLAENQVS